MKDQINKVKGTLEEILKEIEPIAASEVCADVTLETNGSEDLNIEEELKKESKFFVNYRIAAPTMMSTMFDEQNFLKMTQDQVYIDEVLKTKSYIRYLLKSLEETAGVDLQDISTSTRVLTDRVKLLKTLNLQTKRKEVLGDALTLPLLGTKYQMSIDVDQFNSAITFEEKSTPDNEIKSVVQRSDIKLKNYPSVDAYLKAAFEEIGPVKKNAAGLLENHMVIKLFRIIGAYAKSKGKELKINL
jgi:hypothetical protein